MTYVKLLTYLKVLARLLFGGTEGNIKQVRECTHSLALLARSPGFDL
jgi:hypothetical protein